MSAYGIGKRALDVCLSSIALVVALPVAVPVAGAILATMGRPILFRQTRPGINEEPFEILKFRTMREPPSGEDPLRSDAERITRLGRFLRESSLDELPTFFNVLRGDMSLVGPRPLLMRYLDRYSSEQRRRHDVKPGITGWAQINGRNAMSWEAKFAHDVWYVDNASMGLDLKILYRTVVRVLRREGIAHDDRGTNPEFMG